MKARDLQPGMKVRYMKNWADTYEVVKLDFAGGRWRVFIRSYIHDLWVNPRELRPEK